MFTGIIVAMAEAVSLRKKQPGAGLTIKTPGIAKETVIGDSISINGVCLTVVSIEGNLLSFDISDETLISTNLGNLRPGDRLNLEPSLRPDGKLGGHFVTGHIDAVGTIKEKTLSGDTYKLTIGAPLKVTSLLVEKGSVAIDGISLTVVEVFEDSFTLVIIPHTADITTLGFKKTGDTVNLEADILGKYVAKFLGRGKGKSGSDKKLMESLMKAGYV